MTTTGPTPMQRIGAGFPLGSFTVIWRRVSPGAGSGGPAEASGEQGASVSAACAPRGVLVARSAQVVSVTSATRTKCIELLGVPLAGRDSGGRENRRPKK